MQLSSFSNRQTPIFFQACVDAYKNEELEISGDAFMFPAPAFFQGHLHNFKRKKGIIFKDLDVPSTEGCKGLKRKKERSAIKKNNMFDAIKTAFPALQELVRKKRQVRNEKKRNRKQKTNQ